jgi:putative spermidine/putrescine transport system ATP-binding protein
MADRPALVLRNLAKRFADIPAVDGIDLEVRSGEFITLLGPSGSGKTTTLRMIAGFTAPSAGTIEIDGQDMTRVPPHRRDVGMVFQNYALFPHMTAAQNVAFPLQMRREGRDEIKRRVAEALALVKLGTHGDRYPRQLSGGQQQRIALARAVVFNPRLLLMDEPLGALDKKLREALQLEILRIARQIGATVIYVTHDQEEALVMSDRIAIFNAGRIEQIGSGEDLYDRPVSLFVADFIGESNILRGRLEVDGAEARVVQDGWSWRVPATGSQPAVTAGNAAALVVRPERARLVASDHDLGPDWNTIDADVGEVLYLGSTRKYELTLPTGGVAVVREHVGGAGTGPVPATTWRTGDHVRLAWLVDESVVVADGG